MKKKRIEILMVLVGTILVVLSLSLIATNIPLYQFIGIILFPTSFFVTFFIPVIFDKELRKNL